MAFAAGNLDKIVDKHGDFGGYLIYGSWVRDANGKRGWLINLAGLESGHFTIVDGEIFRSGRRYFAGPEGRAVVDTSPEIAELSTSAHRAIHDALAKWEKDELDKPST